MVRVLLGLDRKPPQDAADALACAICHVHLAQVRKRQESAMSEPADRDFGEVRR